MGSREGGSPHEGRTGATSPFDGSDAPLEIRIKIDYLTLGHGAFGGYLAKGLSDSSLDYGLGLYAAISF